jgi:O-acetyl-ADP-ribose deacetylase (regulator of RNase III)
MNPTFMPNPPPTLASCVDRRRRVTSIERVPWRPATTPAAMTITILHPCVKPPRIAIHDRVDGAIHRVAGPELLAECRTLNGCNTGDAKITRGYHLSARHVIHTVGPVWQGGGAGEADLLASCYRRSLDVAAAHGVRSIAFPAISTGVYGFPPDLAAAVAVRTVHDSLGLGDFDTVIFCCFGAPSARLHANALAELSL